MLTVLVLGGASAEENVTTTSVPDGAAPELHNFGCFSNEVHFHRKGDPLGARCHLVCDQGGLLPFHGSGSDTVPDAMDFTRGKQDPHSASPFWDKVHNVMGLAAHNSKMKCNGCAESVCISHNARPCFTEAQINAGFTEFTHGCMYGGSLSNTCAYDGAFGSAGTWDGEVIINDIMPEASCRYTYVGNTYMGDIAAIEHLIQV
jgi:hypothetical protein